MNCSKISQRSEAIQEVSVLDIEKCHDGGDHRIEKPRHLRFILEIVSVEKSGIIYENATKDLDEL